MAITRWVLCPLRAENPAGPLAACESVCVFPRSGGRNPLVAALIQRGDVPLLAMITWKARGCCRGFGVSLCILGMMDEMIQPKARGQLSSGKLRHSVAQRWKYTRCQKHAWHIQGKNKNKTTLRGLVRPYKVTRKTFILNDWMFLWVVLGHVWI